MHLPALLQPVSLELTSGQLEFDYNFESMTSMSHYNFESMSPRSGFSSFDKATAIGWALIMIASSS